MQVLWSIAKLRCCEETEANALAARLVELIDNKEELKPQELSSALWAMGSLGLDVLAIVFLLTLLSIVVAAWVSIPQLSDGSDNGLHRLVWVPGISCPASIWSPSCPECGKCAVGIRKAELRSGRGCPPGQLYHELCTGVMIDCRAGP